MADKFSFSDAISTIFVDLGIGFELYDHQKEVLQYIWDSARHDCVVQWPTGGGKSLIFQCLGRLTQMRDNRTKRGITLVIVPLNIIGDDQIQRLKETELSVCTLGITGKVKAVPVACVSHDDDGGDNEEEAFAELDTYDCDTDASLAEIIDGKYELIISHPEAFINTEFGRRLLDSQEFCDQVHSIVIDEAHTVQQWGKDFRTAFDQLSEVGAFIPSAAIIGLSATFTPSSINFFREHFNLVTAKVFRETIDRNNIFYEVVQKPPSSDARACAESVYKTEIDELFKHRNEFPVTLLYMPLDWIARAAAYAYKRFGDPRKGPQPYGLMYLKQTKKLKDYITQQLKLRQPHLRLVFCTSTIGMGFDSPSIQRVLHAKPPHTMTELVQQSGRAGRAGQQALSRVYYNRGDVSAAITAMSDDVRLYCKCDGCLRVNLLSCFEFTRDGDKFICGCFCCYNCKKSNCGVDVNHNLELSALTSGVESL